MSLWSIFYSGNTDRLRNLLSTEDWQGIEKAKDIHAVDFSGGAIQPFLSPDDFNQVVFQVNKGSKVCISKFVDAFHDTIWGGPDMEYQAAILAPDFIRLLGDLSDNSLTEINRLINERRSKEITLKHKCQRLNQIVNRIKMEMAFNALPCALSLGVLLGRFSIIVKVLIPICSFSLFYGVRFWLYSKSNNVRRGGHGTYDWTESLTKLRNLAITATRNKENVIYLRSL